MVGVLLWRVVDFGGVRNFGVVALFRGVFHGFLLSASDLTVCVMTVWQPSSGGVLNGGFVFCGKMAFSF